jgi:heat shock protein HspQ
LELIASGEFGMIMLNPDVSDEGKPKSGVNFSEGQLVAHRRYGYRGVIVAFDNSCQADLSWYLANQTQPDRNQPWYHVLVHGSSSCTYVAQENLLTDESGLPISHSLLDAFFNGFAAGRYLRNESPWPA